MTGMMQRLSITRRTLLAGLAALPAARSGLAWADGQREMLIYCGITMVKPIKEIAGIIEAKHNVKINISQGASEDLYDALQASRVGDIYFPGSSSYREQHVAEGLLGDATLVAYNVAALMTQKGNPKKVKGDVRELLRSDLGVVVCDPDTGSIGNESKLILERAGIFAQIMERSAYLTTDSRNLIQALKNKHADLALNWRATAFFPENRNDVDVVDLDAKIAKPKKLELSLLTFSKQQDLARAFIAYSASADGQAIFRKHGFLDSEMRGDY